LLQVKVWRKGKNKTLSTILGTYSNHDVPTIPVVSKRSHYFYEGMILQNVCTEVLNAIAETYGVEGANLYGEFLEAQSKVIITAIDEESQAAELDLHIGDYVCEVDGKKIKSILDFDRAIKRATKIKSKIVIKTSVGSFGVFENQAPTSKK
jgi:hypothetical protein